MASAEPLVSVIIPTYNREGMLREAVASVFAQTYQNWELIVVDDGSTDGTREYVRALRDARVRLIAHEHCRNPGRLRNVGMSDAQGEYLAFLDDDDYWKPEKLRIQILDLTANPASRWGYTRCIRIDQDGKENPPNQAWLLHEGWILPQVIAVDAWIAVPAVVVRREAMIQIGGFDETVPFCEDYDAWLRLAELFQVRAVPDVLVVLRTHGSNVSHAHRERLADNVRVYQRLLARGNLGPLQSLSRAQLAWVSVLLADQCRGERRYRDAWHTLFTSWSTRPLYWKWWRAALKTVVHPFLPGPLLNAYRAMVTSA